MIEASVCGVSRYECLLDSDACSPVETFFTPRKCQEEEKQSSLKRLSDEGELDDEKAQKKPRLQTSASPPPIDAFDEDIMNGDREASEALREAAKKKIDQAEAWKKLFDEAQDGAYRVKE